MEWKKNVMNSNIKKIKDVCKKVMVCLILVAMFMVYVIPIKSVFAKGSQLYRGEYTTLSCECKEILEAILKQAQWNKFKNSNVLDENGKELNLLWSYTPGTGEITEGKITNSNSIYKVTLPNNFFSWIEKKVKIDRFEFVNMDLSRSNYAFPDFRPFYSVKYLVLKDSIVTCAALYNAASKGYFGEKDVVLDGVSYMIYDDITQAEILFRISSKGDANINDVGRWYWDYQLEKNPNGNNYYAFEHEGEDGLSFLEQLRAQIEQAYKKNNSNKTPYNAPITNGKKVLVDKNYFYARS